MADTPSPASNQATIEYKNTLFLPRTDFPMRAGLSKSEPKHLERWARIKLYDRLREDAKGRAPFILHDGPPYANGHLHIGHALNKVLKDIVIRSRQMSGYDTPYIPGWDCHGLPIEWKVEEDFRAKGQKKDTIPAATFRAACRAYADKWVDIQRKEFQRLGIEGDWATPYLTMHFNAEASIVAECLKFAEQGLLYQGSKPVMWSPVEQTALAEAEIEYHDHQSTTIWVKFPLVPGTGAQDLGSAHVVIWTTTPWTIPGNRAICFGPQISYGLYEISAMQTNLDFEPWSQPGDRLVLADALAESIQEAGLIERWERLRSVTADELATAHCHHPLRGFSGGYNFEVPLLSAAHVTDDAGTGFVHTAPGHGQDDYFAWLGAGKAVADIPYTVGPDGAYTDGAPGFEGEKILVTEGKKSGKDGSANRAVIAQLIAYKHLLARGRITHSYPHSWRSKAPVIFRNTPQWFIRLDDDRKGQGGLRDTALGAIEKTRFIPESGRNRITSMLQGRPDWLISRQRTWGVPLTLFVHTQTGQLLVDKEVNARIITAIEQQGADAWFETPAAHFLGTTYAAQDYEKIQDILDVWFDSGSTHAFVLEQRDDLPVSDRVAKKEPIADLYLEGSDQHRGWFQSSLLEACGTRGHAPYKSVLTHGFVLDNQGHKMSKSLGNVVNLQNTIDQYGADVLRLWVASADYTDDLRIGKEILHSAVDAYRKLRNTVRYLLGATCDLPTDCSIDLDLEQVPELERYMLHLLYELSGKVYHAYECYDFKTAWRAVSHFCTMDLSAFYLDIRKDSLYCDAADDPHRNASRAVMDICLQHILRWLAPICPFTMEEAYLSRFPDRQEHSVHLEQFAAPPEAWHQQNLVDKWTKIRQVRRVVTGALEQHRHEKTIGSSLEAAPQIHIADAALHALCTTVDMSTLCITSNVTLDTGTGADAAFRLEDVPGVAVSFVKAEGQKCHRCWRILPEVRAPRNICNRCADVIG